MHRISMTNQRDLAKQPLDSRLNRRGEKLIPRFSQMNMVWRDIRWQPAVTLKKDRTDIQVINKLRISQLCEALILDFYLGPQLICGHFSTGQYAEQKNFRGRKQ